jgi:uncharacterized membrane protein YjfL (UPF0719 family)
VQSGAYPVCLDCGVRFEEEPARGVWRFVLVLIAVVTVLWVVCVALHIGFSASTQHCEWRLRVEGNKDGASSYGGRLLCFLLLPAPLARSPSRGTC